MADEINSAELVAALNNLASLSSEVSQSMAYNTEIMKKLAVAQGVNLKSLGSLDTDFAKLSGRTREQSALAQANAHATEQMYKAAGNFSAALISSTASIVSLGKALLTTEKSFAKYGSGVDAAGDAAYAIGKNFGIAGMAIGAMTKAATMVVSASMKQADAALKATDDLSSVGAAGQLTAKGVLDMGHSMGLTSKNMEVFSKAAKSVGTGLINLGDNAGAGVQAFAKMTAVGSESRQAFQRLGVSQEELMERQSDYVKLQEASGQMITKRMHADGKVQALSLKYAEDLTVISTITGKNATEAAAGMAAAKASADIQLKQAMMQRQEEKLRSTGRVEEADDLRKQRLIQDQILNAAQQTGDAQVLAAVQNKLATGSYSEASAMLLRTGIDIDKTMSDANKKTLKQIEAEGVAGEAAAAFQTDYKDKIGKIIDTQGAGIIFTTDSMKAFGINIASLGFVAKTAETDINARNKAALKTIEENKAKTGVSALDPAQKARNALTEAEIAAQVALDSLLGAVNPLLLGFTATTVAATAFTVALGLASVRMMALTAGSGIGGSTVAKIANAGMSMGAGAARFAGPAAGVVAAGASVYGAYGDYQKATTTEGKAGAVGKGVGGAGGAMGGAMGGAAMGAALGSVVPVLGTAVGGLIGAAVGGWLGSKGGELVGEKVGTIAGKALAGSSDDKTKLEDVTKSQNELAETNKEASKKTEKSNDGLIKALNATTTSLDKVTGGTPGAAATATKTAPAAAASVTAPATPKKSYAEILEEQNKQFPSTSAHSRLANERAAQARFNAQKGQSAEPAIKTAPAAAAPVAATIKSSSATNDPNKSSATATIKSSSPGGGSAAEKMFDKSQKQAQGAQARAAAADGSGATSAGTSVGAANSELEKYAKTTGTGALAANITKFESGKAGYNAYNRGTVGNKMIGSDKPIDFSTMTISEYLKHGKLSSGDPDKIFAMGKYQIIPGTMEGLVKKLGLDPDKTFLDSATQDILFNEGLIKKSRPNVAAYLSRKSDDRDAAILDMSKEFASVGVPYPAGKASVRGESYYAGVGGNKAHNPPEAVGAALDADRVRVSAAKGGITDGPTSGYPATLHGSEIIAPLSANSILEQLGKTPASQATSSTSSTTTSDTIKEIYSMNTDVMEMLAEKLDAVIDKLSSGNDISDKLLKYSRV